MGRKKVDIQKILDLHKEKLYNKEIHEITGHHLGVIAKVLKSHNLKANTCYDKLNIDITTHSWCFSCKEIKLLEKFSKGRNKNGKKSQCKQCAREEYLKPDNHTKAQIKAKERYEKIKHTLVSSRLTLPLNEYLYKSAKNRACRSNMEFNIEIADIIIPEYCPLLNIPLKTNSKQIGPDSYTVDRIDSTKGYVKGNVWIISSKANTMKSNSTLEEIELLVNNWRKFHNNNNFNTK